MKKNPFSEIILVFIEATSIYLFISLSSFSSRDSSWHNKGFSDVVFLNEGGKVGSYLSDLLLSFLGATSFSFVFIISLLGFILIKSSPLKFNKINFLGFVSLFVSLMIILSLYPLKLTLDLPRNSGGIIGEELGGILVYYFGYTGGTMISGLTFIIGLTLMLNFSWLNLFEHVGKFTLNNLSILTKRMPEIKIELEKEEETINEFKERSEPSLSGI